MERTKRWIAAVFGLVPMGTTEALVLIAAGAVGAVSVHAVVLQTTDPVYWWILWWVGIAASVGLLFRGLFAVVAAIARRAGLSLGWLTERLPVEFRSPVVRKMVTVGVPPPDAPLGFLDFEAEAVIAMKRMTRHLGLIGRETVALGKTLAHYTPKFANAAGWSPEAKRALGRETGAKVDGHARRMEDQQVLLRQGIEAMAPNYLERIKYVDADAGGQVRPSIAGMRDATASSRPSIIGLRDATITIRKQNVQQSINRASDRLIDVLGRLISDFDAVTRFTTDALQLIDEKIAAANVEKAQEEQAETEPAAPPEGETAG